MTTRCAARPDDLHRAALVLDRLSADLAAAVRDLDAAVQWFETAQAGAFALLHHRDPIVALPDAVAELGSWVDRLAVAFARAGEGLGLGPAATVTTDDRTVDGWPRTDGWRPGRHLAAALSPDEWLAAVAGRACTGFQGAGYVGKGFLVGPDGRRYPLVAPWVERDGVTYHAEATGRPDGSGVLDLDGRDRGWTTVAELSGVERWRDQPGALERALTGVGSTAAGPPRGSTEADVNRVLLVPFGAPVFAPAPPPDRRPLDAAAATYDPIAPDFPPPNDIDLVFPRGQRSLGGSTAMALPVAVDLAAGVADADRGSFAAYDVVLQRNDDGRTRALYKRVFVGADEEGRASLTSVWVTGPERNDQVTIEYAPGG